MKLAAKLAFCAVSAFALMQVTSVGAQPPKALPFHAETDPTKIQAGPYVVEPDHTRVMFGVNHKGFTTYYGQFSNVTGDLMLDIKNPAASKFDIKVPVGTISTTNAVLDEELKHKPWLDSVDFPTIAFKSTSVKPTGPNTADVTGDFTFHGVTKPLTLKVKFNGAGVDPNDHYYVAGFTVTGTLKRSDFGVPVAVPVIGDDVDLIISAAFKKP